LKKRSSHGVSAMNWFSAPCAACRVRRSCLVSCASFAYTDCPLPIEEGQTISQPYIVAFMTEALALQGGERVLEIGTGSGYAAAVLAEIAADVYTVERIGQLAEKAASTLADLGYDNVHVLHSDGTAGRNMHPMTASLSRRAARQSRSR
jgi:protein-L-isoaspartate(D-aspartate) O-methyltransferase